MHNLCFGKCSVCTTGYPHLSWFFTNSVLCQSTYAALAPYLETLGDRPPRTALVPTWKNLNKPLPLASFLFVVWREMCSQTEGIEPEDVAALITTPDYQVPVSSDHP